MAYKGQGLDSSSGFLILKVLGPYHNSSSQCGWEGSKALRTAGKFDSMSHRPGSLPSRLIQKEDEHGKKMDTRKRREISSIWEGGMGRLTSFPLGH